MSPLTSMGLIESNISSGLSSGGFMCVVLIE